METGWVGGWICHPFLGMYLHTAVLVVSKTVSQRERERERRRKNHVIWENCGVLWVLLMKQEFVFFRRGLCCDYGIFFDVCVLVNCCGVFVSHTSKLLYDWCYTFLLL